MTNRSTTHATFVIERDLPHAPAKVFAAYADPKKKSKWFGGPAEWESKHTMDFRIGGKEISSGGPPGGTVHTMTGEYWDIVENELGLARHDRDQSECGGSKLIYTEQGVYLDGYDDAGQREEGTLQLIGQLEAFLST